MDVEKSLHWRRSTACDSNSCVEVAATEHHVLIRNSGLPDEPTLSVPHAAWQVFLADLRCGEPGLG
jgi:hypothetical protein